MMKTNLQHIFLRSYLNNKSQSEYPATSTFANMEFKDLKKEIHWFWKIELNGRKIQEKAEPEQNFLALNPGENKMSNKNGNFFKVECNKCGKYGHRASDYWGSSYKNDNINGNKTARNPRFNGECKNYGKKGHRAVDCWAKKVKDKDVDFDKLFMGATFRG